MSTTATDPSVSMMYALEQEDPDIRQKFRLNILITQVNDPQLVVLLLQRLLERKDTTWKPISVLDVEKPKTGRGTGSTERPRVRSARRSKRRRSIHRWSNPWLLTPPKMKDQNS